MIINCKHTCRALQVSWDNLKLIVKVSKCQVNVQFFEKKLCVTIINPNGPQSTVRAQSGDYVIFATDVTMCSAAKFKTEYEKI